MKEMQHFAEFRGYLCTAREDGAIPLNAKSIGLIAGVDNTALLRQMLDQANAWATIYRDLNKLRAHVESGDQERYMQSLRELLNTTSLAISKFAP